MYERERERVGGGVGGEVLRMGNGKVKEIEKVEERCRVR